VRVRTWVRHERACVARAARATRPARPLACRTALVPIATGERIRTVGNVRATGRIPDHRSRRVEARRRRRVNGHERLVEALGRRHEAVAPRADRVHDRRNQRDLIRVEPVHQHDQTRHGGIPTRHELRHRLCG